MRRIATENGTVGRTAGPDAVRVIRALLALVALLAAGAARAERVRMLILVGSEQDRELAARVRGQTADLDAVVATAEGALPPDLEGRKALARAARSRADVVVWFGTDEGGQTLAYVARGDTVLVRRISVAPGALSRSAASEAVALAVRTALTGFAASRAAEPESAEPPEREPRLRAWGEVGGVGLLDGTADAGHYGVSGRVGAAKGRWYLGAALALQPQAAIDAAPASIEVERQQAALVLGADVLPGANRPDARWGLGVELGLGAVRYRRVTTATGTGLVATASAETWSPVAAPGVRVARRLFSFAWLALEAGADVVSRPPQFGVQRTTGFDRLATVWAAQPRLAISLLLDPR
jgi:hypothetical protein